MLQKLRKLFSARERDARLQAQLEQLRQRTPVPLFWLFGRTQSGKTSVVRYLTGAADAEIGQGFRPCTRFSRLYQFPTADAPLLTFLDTRGLDEPGYDPAEDLERFGDSAHVVIVVARLLDHALENVRQHLRTIRTARPGRPVLLVLTCLHEAYPQQQHPLPYPFAAARMLPPDSAAPVHTDPLGLLTFDPSRVAEPLARSLSEQEERFSGLVDRVVPVDLTHPEEGFNEANYGGDLLKQELLDILPGAYRQTLLTLEEASKALQDFYERSALPYIVGYSTLAATAGAIPVPWLDLLILPGIQTRMIYALARLYGQPLSGTRFLELASTLGLGVVARQALRELMKFIPYVGSVAGAALAAASTFALGKAFCFYYSAVHKGHVPRPEDLRRYYREELALAEKAWKALHPPRAENAPAAAPSREGP
jgi:uncharacterized protein (DUF697 family)